MGALAGFHRAFSSEYKRLPPLFLPLLILAELRMRLAACIMWPIPPDFQVITSGWKGNPFLLCEVCAAENVVNSGLDCTAVTCSESCAPSSTGCGFVSLGKNVSVLSSHWLCSQLAFRTYLHHLLYSLLSSRGWHKDGLHCTERAQRLSSPHGFQSMTFSENARKSSTLINLKSLFLLQLWGTDMSKHKYE